MNARERALDAQRKLNWFSNHENGIVWARSWRATEGLPLGMRYAELGAARLAALDFLHDPEEPLIGRLAVPELDPAENERAWEFIHASGVELPGQTGHAEPYYDDLFALGLDGLREKAGGTPSFVRAAEGRTVLEFGSRRAQGSDAAILGARAAYIGGCHGTACTISDQLYGVRAGGTMAHAWVQMFDSELEAFKTYCKLYPTNATLLVDTYNTLHSGVPNAIRAFNEVLKPLGITRCGIRLDSGDMAYLTRKARQMLDEAGWTECQISVSNSLDEYLIQDLLHQGACIDMFGVGERLITARSEPVFGGVYKLAAVEDGEGHIIPKIKISENVGKITNPHFKKLYRFYGNDTGKAIADYLCLHDETVDDSKDLEIFDPEATWKTKTVYNFTAKELQVPIFRQGQLVYRKPTLEEIRAYCQQQVDTLWDEVKRFDNPHTYYVDLSRKLWTIKNDMLRQKR